MKKLGLIALLAIFSIFGAMAQTLISTSDAAIVELYETERVTLDDFKAVVVMIEQQSGKPMSFAQREQLLQQKVNDILLVQAANNAGVQVTTEEFNMALQKTLQQIKFQGTIAQFKAALENDPNASYESFSENITNRILQEKFLMQTKPIEAEDIPEPTESEIQAFYKENEKAYQHGDIIQLQHIYVSTANLSAADKQTARAKAQDLLNKIIAGESFESVAKFYSDDMQSRPTGGFIGPIDRTNPQIKQLFGANFYNAVFNLQVNELSDVIESNGGYHIVRVTGSIGSGTRKLDQTVAPQEVAVPGMQVGTETVRGQIVKVLKAQLGQKMIQQNLAQLIEDLRSKADIRIMSQNLNW